MHLPSFLETPKLRWRALLVAVVSALVFWILIAGWKALVPFFIGFLLTYLMLPVVHLFDNLLDKVIPNKGLTRTLSIIITYIIVLAVIALFIFMFVPVIRDQFSALIKNLPSIYDRVIKLLRIDLPSFVARIPPEFQTILTNNLNQALDAILVSIQRGVLRSFMFLTQTISFVLGLLVVPVWIFIVLKDEDKVWRGFYGLVPAKARDDARYLVQIAGQVMNAYIRSQLIGMFLVWVLTTIAFMAIGVDLAVLWGTFAGVTEIIPIIGPYLGVIPPVIWTLAYRPDITIWVIVAHITVQNVVGTFMMPRISGDATRIHPAIIIILVLVGAQAGGFWGILLIIPLTAMVRDIFRYLYIRTTDKGETPQEALATFRATAIANYTTKGIRFFKG